MESRNELIDSAADFVSTEIAATLEVRESSGSQAGKAIDNARDARTKLLSVLHDAAKLQDIDALLAIERIFLEEEREHLAESPKKTASLNKAVREIDAAITMLTHVRSPEDYRLADIYFSLPHNRLHDLPKDQAHQFFASHATRLGNVEKHRLEDGERKLIVARIDNIKMAQQLYTEFQRQALAGVEVREPKRRYILGWDSELADCA